MPITFTYPEGSPMWCALVRASMEYGIAGTRFSRMREKFWTQVSEALHSNLPEEQKAQKIFMICDAFQAMRKKSPFTYKPKSPYRR